MPIKRIAERLRVSPSSVLNWTKDIELTPEQTHRNQFGPGGPQNPEHVAKRVASWRAKNHEKRRSHQDEGRRRAREMDPLHSAGCMLYWAEGSKHRNTLVFCNSDMNMAAFFSRFLRESMGVSTSDFRLRLNVYLNNGLRLEEIEDRWLVAVEAPRTILRGHSVNHLPTSSSGNKRTLPYGVCSLSVARSTWLIQHIYGAIQEYASFDEPRWLDLPH